MYQETLSDISYYILVLPCRNNCVLFQTCDYYRFEHLPNQCSSLCFWYAALWSLMLHQSASGFLCSLGHWACTTRNWLGFQVWLIWHYLCARCILPRHCGHQCLHHSTQGSIAYMLISAGRIALYIVSTTELGACRWLTTLSSLLLLCKG